MRRTAVILAALALDTALGDPPNTLHPVAWMGKLVSGLMRWAPGEGPKRQFAYGAFVVAATCLAAAGPAWLLERQWRRPRTGGKLRRAGYGIVRFVLDMVLLKVTFALHGLLQASGKVKAALEQDDLDAARREVRSLVSRDTAELSPELVAAAAVESVAENFTDSVVAPFLAYRLFGLSGAVVYRVVNTCDAMIGYRGRYEYLGKAAARLDDVFNLGPARLGAALLVAASPLAGGSPRGAARMVWRDHGRTESPNAGWTMAAAAGALGVQLEKRGHYRLGDAAQPVTPQTIAGAARLVSAGTVLGAGLLILYDGRTWLRKTT